MINRRSYLYLFTVSLSFILVVTIFPFSFVIPKSISFSDITKEFYIATNIKDYVRNILLFIPFGISFRGILERYKCKILYSLLAILLCSAILSFSIELIQVFLPDRISSISDLVCNSLGGVFGASLYNWHRQISNFFRAIISKKYEQINSSSLIIAISAYCLILASANLLLFSKTNLSNWNNNYHLAIGSDVEGSAAWNGYLTNLYISDRRLTEPEVKQAFIDPERFFSQLSSLIAGFVLIKDRAYYQDLNKQIPALTWQQDFSFETNNLDSQNGQSINKSTNKYQRQEVWLNHENSLITQAIPLNLARRIKHSHQFTLSLTAATNRLQQVGPARIIAYAGNLQSRNFIVAQEGTNLILFLRTPISANGGEPSFIIPNVFNDYSFHQIIIAFKANKIEFYIDNWVKKYSFPFQLTTVGQVYLPWQISNWRIDVTKLNLIESKLTFYGITLLPVAILFSIWLTKITE